MTLGESRTGGEFANGGESEVLAYVDAARRKVLVVWLRDDGYDGCADDLEAEVAGHAARIAYEIADHMESVYGGDDLPQLVWHLRDWADRHEKLERKIDGPVP